MSGRGNGKLTFRLCALSPTRFFARRAWHLVLCDSHTVITTQVGKPSDSPGHAVRDDDGDVGRVTSVSVGGGEHDVAHVAQRRRRVGRLVEKLEAIDVVQDRLLVAAMDRRNTEWFFECCDLFIWSPER